MQKRQVLDGALVANEVVCWTKKKKSKGVLLKVDFHKTYDTVMWDFLDKVLERMGFGDKWSKWIAVGVSTESMSTLVNGSTSLPF